MAIAMYPGSFDPVTNGHLDIATRAAAIFEKLIVAVYDAPPKQLLFSTEDRVTMFRQAVADVANINVQAYTGLTVDAARRIGAQVIVRGLRASQDFEREFEMALMNQKLAPDIEEVFFATNLGYQFVSSSLLKEVVQLGGDISDLVPVHVLKLLKERYGLRELPIDSTS